VLAGAAVLLVAALAADAGGVAALPGRTHPAGWLSDASSAIGVTIGLAGLVVLAALVTLIARRPRRRRDEPPRVVILPTTSRLTQVLILVTVIGALAAPFVLLATTPRHPAASRPPTTITGTAPSSRPSDRHPSSTTSGGRHHGHSLLLLGIITGVLVAAAVGAAARQGDTEAEVDSTSNDDDSHLRADVEAAAVAATTALDTADGDPRQAVIAAYTAMTRALTMADPRLRATDTPGRLLDRAAAAGVVDVVAASTLIQLFERARFSTHPVTPSHVAAAREALARVRVTTAAPAGAR
jgi:hypothetical protein